MIAVAGVGIIGWIAVHEPIVATACVIAADLIGAAMMVPKTYRDPGSETLATFAFASLGGALAAGAVGVLDISLLLYPIYFCLVNGAIALLIHQRLSSRVIASTIPARGGVNTSIAVQPSGPAWPPWGTCGGITTQSPACVTRVSSPTVKVSSPLMTIAICCSEWWCMSATALGSKVTKFVITESVVIGWKAMPGTRWSAGRSLKFAQRPASSEASPDRSK